jgi:RNA polymerase sigma-70 factor (ECF subfamily)
VFDGLKFREVAERLGCPLNTALARMHDGIRTLRRLWEERYA